VIALEEIQDNNGAVDNGVVDANQTLGMLTKVVADAGGRAHLTLSSPGRVDPLNPAWEATRKPLAREFVWSDRR
jgi:hypothetical protein